jgi:citrate synthase
MSGTDGGLIRGLEGVVAATTRLCDLDGVNGRLAYQGYAIEDLARHASFEEVTWLLWHGERPGPDELAAFRKELTEAGPLPAEAVKVLKLLPKTMHPMRVLQMGIALLGGLDPDAEDGSPEANRRKATRLVARVSSLTAAFHRIRIGRRPIPPRADLSHAANFLYMLSGRKPRVVPLRAFDAALVLYAEHELNASTFTARVVASTLADMHSAVSAAVGAL